MFQRIMIAMDSSPQATLALKVARAHFPDSERRLLTVLDERTLPLPSPEQPARTREELIAEAQTALLALTLTQESCKTVVGERVPTLLKAAHAFGADLLVIGTHGRRGLNRWLSGSVAEEVIRKAGLPVLVIREASVPLKDMAKTPKASAKP